MHDAETHVGELMIESSRTYEQLHDAELKECTLIEERKWLKDLVDRLTGLDPDEVGSIVP